MRMSRDEEQETNFRIGHEIVIAVDAIVAWALWHQQSARTLNRDESRCIPTRRGIRPAIRISGRQHEKWRAANERAGVFVDMGEIFLLCQYGGHAEVAR